MSKKVLGNINDRNFVFPEDTTSLQKPVRDFRTPDGPVLGNINDPDFAFPLDEETPPDYGKLAESRSKGINPLIPFQKEREKVAESIEIPSEEKSQAPVQMGKAAAKSRLNAIEFEFDKGIRLA